MSEGTITLLANKEEGNGGARIVAGIAMLLAPPVIALEVGSWSPGLLIGTSVGAGLLVFAMLSLRRWIGGIDEVSIADAGLGLAKKGDLEVFPWDELTMAKFHSVNGTPWLLISTKEDLHRRVCLEDFDEAARATITSGIMARIPERTESTKTWIVANRIPRSVTERGVAIMDEARETGE